MQGLPKQILGLMLIRSSNLFIDVLIKFPEVPSVGVFDALQDGVDDQLSVISQTLAKRLLIPFTVQDPAKGGNHIAQAVFDPLHQALFQRRTLLGVVTVSTTAVMRGTSWSSTYRGFLKLAQAFRACW